MENTWKNFWNKKQDGFDRIMQNTTAYFYRNYNQKFPLSDSDTLLDYGCGPGFFLSHYSHSKNLFLGIDISENYIHQCNSKFKTLSNFKFFHMKDPEDFSFLQKTIKENNVDKIVCISVLQYFNDEETVISFLDSVFQAGCKQVTFGDVLPKKSSIIRDTFQVLIGSVKYGFFCDYIVFIIKTLFSDYFKKDRPPLLTFNKNFFTEYSQSKNLKSIFLNLTIPKTRYTVVISI